MDVKCLKEKIGSEKSEAGSINVLRSFWGDMEEFQRVLVYITGYKLK